MNREIKFRFWDKRNGDMKTPITLKDLADFIVPKKDIETWDEELIPMQFTGFKDQSDKEIFEGDQLYDSGYLCTVIFENGCFKSEYKHPEDGEVLTLEELGTSGFVIVGNIYENPELLK